MIKNATALTRLINLAQKRAYSVAQKVLKYTAADVKRAASRSIRPGGKTRQSKGWTTSKPGEPPRSHKGTLKQGIKYIRVSDVFYLIGPSHIGSSRALKVLEYGGQGEIRTTTYSDEYVANRKRKRRGKNGIKAQARPKAKRAYHVASKSVPKGIMVREYLYFKSRASWEAAKDNPNFMSWANAQRKVETVQVNVKKRPFMRPALAQEVAEDKMKARFTRASK